MNPPENMNFAVVGQWANERSLFIQRVFLDPYHGRSPKYIDSIEDDLRIIKMTDDQPSNITIYAAGNLGKIQKFEIDLFIIVGKFELFTELLIYQILNMGYEMEHIFVIINDETKNDNWVKKNEKEYSFNNKELKYIERTYNFSKMDIELVMMVIFEIAIKNSNKRPKILDVDKDIDSIKKTIDIVNDLLIGNKQITPSIKSHLMSLGDLIGVLSSKKLI